MVAERFSMQRTQEDAEKRRGENRKRRKALHEFHELTRISTGQVPYRIREISNSKTQIPNKSRTANFKLRRRETRISSVCFVTVKGRESKF